MIGPLLNLIVPGIVKRGGRGIGVRVSLQLVEWFLHSRIVGVPLQELRKHGLGL